MGKSFANTLTEPVKSTAPAMAFISTAEKQTTSGEETKGKRLNLLIKPSLFTKVKKIATIQRLSVNELINQVLEGYAQQHSADIDKYTQIYGEDI